MSNAADLAKFANDGLSGAVLQVKQYRKTDTFSSSSTSFVDVTDFELDITPSSTSSDIFIICNLMCHHDSALQDEFRLQRKIGSGSFATFGSVPSDRVMFSSGYFGSNTSATGNFSFLDSPATTDTVTYKLQFRSRHSNTFVLNHDWNSDEGGISVMILQEIAG